MADATITVPNINFILSGSGLYNLNHIEYPAGLIANAAISPTAAIAASKCQRSLRAVHRQAGNAVDETVILFFVKGATLTFKHFTVSHITPCVGSSTVTVDVLKNGTSILSGATPITLNSSNTAYQEVLGVITTTSAVDGDYVTLVINETTSGTDAIATGVTAQLDYDEDYAS